MLRKNWKVKQIEFNTKLMMFNSNVKAVLLYGSETWRSTQKTLKRIQTFINKRLCRILHLKWTDSTTLWEWTTKQLSTGNERMKRKWRWLGHGNLQKPSPIKSSHGRGEDKGHGTPGKDTERETKAMGYIRRHGQDGHKQTKMVFLSQ